MNNISWMPFVSIIKNAVFLLPLCFAPVPAMADSGVVPRYVVEKHCQDVARFGGGSNSLYNSCIDMEQNAYDALKSSWAGISTKIRDYCNGVAQFGGGSYSLLESCIEMETSAGSNSSSFKY